MNRIGISDRTIKQLSVTQADALAFKEKIEVAKLLDRLGVDVIELDEIRKQKIDSLLIKSIVTAVKESVIAVPVPLGQSPEITMNALKEAIPGKRCRLQVEAPVSSVRMEYICHKKPAVVETMVKDTVAACVAAVGDRGIAVEFIADDATRADRAFLYRMIQTAVAAGAGIVTLCDDAGTMLPPDFAEFLREIRENVPELSGVTLGVSCSDELTMAGACGIAAIKEGAGEIKATTYPAGLISLPNMARVIAGKGDSLNVTTGINTTAMKRTVEQVTRMALNENEPETVFGAAHSEESEVLSCHDDCAAVEQAAKKLGYDLSEEDVTRVFEEFTRIAAKKEVVSTRELDAIIASTAMQVPPTYCLVSYIANTGNEIASMVHIKLTKNGTALEDISMGDGPIDAAFLAIEKITGKHFELENFQIRAITEGKEATGETIVRLTSNGKVFSGRGLSTDIIGASIRAYINALNKIVYEEEEA